MRLERVLEPEVMDTWADAAEYDAMDFTEVNRAFAERALELGPHKGRVLDFGTGTARIPILMLQRNKALRIVANDYSRNMLKIGEINVIAAGFGNYIELRHEDAKNTPHLDGDFDLVISNSLVHHLPDPLLFLREAGRVARPNAGILIRDLIRPESIAAMNALVEQYAGESDAHQRKLFRDSLNAALTLAEIGVLVQKAGFQGERVVQSSDRHWSIERKWRKAE